MSDLPVRTLVTTFAGAALVTVVLTPIVAALARRLGLLDQPGGRHVHTRAVPRIGGIAVFLGLAVGAVIYGLSFGWERFRWAEAELLAFLLPCLLMLAVGVVDDVRGLSPAAKLMAQAVAASFLIQAGYVIDDVANPFGAPIALGKFAFPVTLMWFIAVTNAFNIIDGIDGLLSTVAIASLLGCAAIAINDDRLASATLALALAGALAGFLPWNWHPARVFLGDSGSLVIGLSIAALSIKVTRNLPTQPHGSLALHAAVLLCALPLVETTLTVARRWVSGQALSQGDRSHIHHVLLARGLSVPRATASLALIAALLSASAVLSRFWRQELALVWFAVFVAAALLGLRWLGYIELRVVLDRLRGQLVSGRKGLSGAVAVARAGDRLVGVRTVADVRAAFEGLVQGGGFAYLVLELPLHTRTGSGSERVVVGLPPGPQVASTTFAAPIELSDGRCARLVATRVLDPTAAAPSDADVHRYLLMPLTRAVAELLDREPRPEPARVQP